MRGEFARGAIAASHGTKCTLKLIPFFSPKCGRAQKGEVTVPRTGGSCWQSLPWVMWLGWQLAAQGRCCCTNLSADLPLLPVQNLILSFPHKKIPGQCQFKAASALWAVFDTPGLGPFVPLGPGRALGRSGEHFLSLETNSPENWQHWECFCP